MAKYVLNPQATDKNKNKYMAGSAGGTLAAVAGGYTYGTKASQIGVNRTINRAMNTTHLRKPTKGASFRSGMRDIGHGYKTAIRTKTGAAAAGVAAGGIALSGVAGHKAQKNGTLVKKNSTLSAFGVDHSG